MNHNFSINCMVPTFREDPGEEERWFSSGLSYSAMRLKFCATLYGPPINVESFRFCSCIKSAKKRGSINEVLRLLSFLRLRPCPPELCSNFYIPSETGRNRYPGVAQTLKYQYRSPIHNLAVRASSGSNSS